VVTTPMTSVRVRDRGHSLALSAKSALKRADLPPLLLDEHQQWGYEILSPYVVRAVLLVVVEEQSETSPVQFLGTEPRIQTIAVELPVLVVPHDRREPRNLTASTRSGWTSSLYRREDAGAGQHAFRAGHHSTRARARQRAERHGPVAVRTPVSTSTVAPPSARLIST
jgi:hypothetical protein